MQLPAEFIHKFFQKQFVPDEGSMDERVVEIMEWLRKERKHEIIEDVISDIFYHVQEELANKGVKGQILWLLSLGYTPAEIKDVCKGYLN